MYTHNECIHVYCAPKTLNSMYTVQGYSKIEYIEVKRGILTWATDTGYVGVRDCLSEHEHKQVLSL